VPELPAAFEVVVPTVGRPSLQLLLESLAACRGPRPRSVVLVDDRAPGSGPLDVVVPPQLDGLVRVIPGRTAGPAAARNAGWRTTSTPWVAFLDDDVVVPADWSERLADDLDAAPPWVAGVQGRITVPLPAERRPTDWERNVAGLERARWATADLAYRRSALEDVGGFDERFPRAYREDADLGLRLLARGWWIEQGERGVVHPVRPADRWVSVRLQAGNAADPLMAALHGPGWRERAGVPRGRRRRHLAVTAAGVLALVARCTGRRRLARLTGAAWLAGTAELAWARSAPGPRTPAEVATMAVTSAMLPAAATWHWLRGWAAVAGGLASPSHPKAPRPRRRATDGHGTAPLEPMGAGSGPAAEQIDRPLVLRRPSAVLFDRDGTLVEDVPYNGDPDRVVLRPGVREALDRLRAAGIPTAVISNQSGIGRGLLTSEQVRAVNARVDELAGSLGPWLWCPHGPDDGCACRKPAPGLVQRAAEALGVPARDCVVIGDIGSDVEAAEAAGATGILVPTDITLAEEVAAARHVARDIGEAVDRVLAGAVGAHEHAGGRP
jgi:histidinol-phosphate phosphatase family protein